MVKMGLRVGVGVGIGEDLTMLLLISRGNTRGLTLSMDEAMCVSCVAPGPSVWVFLLAASGAVLSLSRGELCVAEAGVSELGRKVEGPEGSVVSCSQTHACALADEVLGLFGRCCGLGRSWRCSVSRP